MSSHLRLIGCSANILRSTIRVDALGIFPFGKIKLGIVWRALSVADIYRWRHATHTYTHAYNAQCVDRFCIV